MNPLESKILAWAISEYPDLAPLLANQIHGASVAFREFTGGAGAYTHLMLDQGSTPIPSEVLGGQTCIDGPVVASPDLEYGAGCWIWFDHGLLSIIEIYSYTTEYPVDHHPVSFTLH